VSELDFDGEDLGDAGEEFVPPVTDVEALERPPTSKTPVSDRFFHPDGTPRDVVELRSADAVEHLWRQADETQAVQEQAAGPSALESFDPGPSSEQESWADYQVQSEASAYAAAQANAEALAARVAAAGRAREVGVTDAAMLGQVVASVQEAVNGWATSQFAAGASSRQLAEAAQGYEFQSWLDERIAEGLQEARYFQETRNTGLRRHAERSWAAQVVDHELGLRGPPQQIWEKYPQLQRQYASASARAERLAAQREQMDAIVARNRAQAAWRPRSQPKQRKLKN
jgi:hypothetical protein